MSTANIYQTFRNEILGFLPITGNPVSASLAQRLWVGSAPDNATFPYATMRLINQQTGYDISSDYMEAELEIMLYGKPRNQQYVLENVADTIDAAMLRYTDRVDGFLHVLTRSRNSWQSLSTPADREVVTIKLVYKIIGWPDYLTAYSGSV